MMNKNFAGRVSSLALAVAAACAPTVSMAAAPTSGAYVTDAQNTWVQDRVGDRIGTVNMIMCVMSSLRPDAMVNQGAYVALVDENKCEGRGDTSKSTSTNAGASNASSFMSGTVVATQASADDPLIAKIWLHQEENNGGGSPQKMTIYAYIVATAAKSTTNPNGLFSMYFCGMPVGQSSCMFKGALKADNSGLSFYQEESGGGGGGGPSITHLKLQSDPATDSGLGRIDGSENGSAYSYTFAYNSGLFRRADGTNDDCFSRDKNIADTSTWSYGVYNADGSRLEVSNPGFPVKYVSGSNTDYGYWGFWGLNLPDSAMATVASTGTLTRQVNGVDTPLTIVKRGGKLWKLTKHTAVFNEFKNVSMMAFMHNAIGSGPADANYELQWNGTSLNAIGYQQCSPGNPCVQTSFTTPVALNASDFVTAHVSAIPIFFPSGGGNGAILVPASGPFIGTSGITYRMRELVDVSAPTLSLNCIGMCPNGGTNLVSGGSLANLPMQDSGVWGPSPTRYSFTYQAGMLSNGAGNVDASAAAKSSMGNYQWGINSGSMVADADLNSVKCDANGTANTSGAYYCSALVDLVSETYQWETGPNAWNQYFGAAGVTIDPPKALSFVALPSLPNIRAADTAKFDGNSVPLQYSGIGQLQGIPGSCVDPVTNQPGQCNQNNRWVPAFDILDGAEVIDASTTSFYVKYLQREMRLHKVACTGAPSLGAASSMVLPDSSTFDVNPMTVNGAEATAADSKPKVIDGIVQP